MTPTTDEPEPTEHKPMSETSLDELLAALERACDLYDQVQARKAQLALDTDTETVL